MFGTRIEIGKITFVAGASRSGKSMLLTCLAKLAPRWFLPPKNILYVHSYDPLSDLDASPVSRPDSRVKFYTPSSLAEAQAEMDVYVNTGALVLLDDFESLTAEKPEHIRVLQENLFNNLTRRQATVVVACRDGQAWRWWKETYDSIWLNDIATLKKGGLLVEARFENETNRCSQVISLTPDNEDPIEIELQSAPGTV